MSTPAVVVVRGGVRTALAVEPTDGDLLGLLQRHRVALDAACGGAGTCGACVVRVIEGAAERPDGVERGLLSPPRLAAGERLACRLPPDPGLTVSLPVRGGGARHKEELAAAPPPRDPRLRRRRVALPPPSLDDPTSDLERLLRHAGCPRHRLPLAELRELPATLRRAGWIVDVLEETGPDPGGPTLLAVAGAAGGGASVAGASGGPPAGAPSGSVGAGPWGLAVDLGTSTVAAYLLDLGSGRAVDVLAAPNRQSELGADVLSRIAHARAHGVEGLQRRAVAQLGELAARLAARHGLATTDVVDVTVVGNTTMLHGLLGLDPAGIGEAPFVPAVVGPVTYAAAELGLSLHPAARVRTLPSVSAYVGADTVAALLAADFDLDVSPALLVDLGTNGEIVLRHPGGLLACSTAAGPAFEGAGIRCGVGGVDGAVAGFGWPTGAAAPALATVADAPAVGICGAGLLAVVAALLELGVVDDGGRLLPAEELPATVPAAVRARCRAVDGRPAFEVVPAVATADGVAIVLTDRDVRELQLAKAAVAAGIDTLLEHAGVTAEAVERVVLAGGFGAFLDPAAATRVGLLPAALGRRTVALGNAAGLGAVLAATSVSHARRCEAIAARVRVVELSASAAFAAAYVGHMGFGPP